VRPKGQRTPVWPTALEGARESGVESRAPRPVRPGSRRSLLVALRCRLLTARASPEGGGRARTATRAPGSSRRRLGKFPGHPGSSRRRLGKFPGHPGSFPAAWGSFPDAWDHFPTSREVSRTPGILSRRLGKLPEGPGSFPDAPGTFPKARDHFLAPRITERGGAGCSASTCKKVPSRREMRYSSRDFAPGAGSRTRGEAPSCRQRGREP
jgi:hypothetical protein